MISVSEIKKKAEKKYHQVLLAALKNETIFPLELRANKSMPKDFKALQKQINNLTQSSKQITGFGYDVTQHTVKTRKHGIQNVPTAITFSSRQDFLKFIQKERQFSDYEQALNVVLGQLPQLEKWIEKHITLFVNNLQAWHDLVKVCQWFLDNDPAETYYLRELPIEVHTKFIEQHRAILTSLLDFLIPEKVNPGEKDFEKRYGLKHVQPLVRFRFLDPANTQPFSELAVPLDQLAKTPMPEKIFVVIENQMTYLTFPAVPQGIAIWGKGFAVSELQAIKWLGAKRLYFWGDLDTQGFQMLNQLRTHFPQTISLLMDKEVLELFNSYQVKGTSTPVNMLEHLTPQELSAFNWLKTNTRRLEQERIPQTFINQQVRSKLGVD